MDALKALMKDFDPAALMPDLGTFLGKLSNVQALDVLPYHVMGVSKYKELGIDYPLEGVEPATVAQAKEAKKCILTAYWNARRSMTQ